MPIDVEKARGARLPDAPFSWDADDVLLYHLGLGAGTDPKHPGELAYVYEAKLKVLPTYAVVPAFPALANLFGVEGISVNPMMILHGEQTITVHRPLPTNATTTTSAHIVDILDKGKGAAIVIDAVTLDEIGEPLATNRFLAFARGEGGFARPSGGDRGTGAFGPAPGNAPPDREPDLTVESPTLVQQAALYRLSGDKNPLHIDPEFAALGGFDRPILHGLCSYGIVAKAVVDHALDGDVGAVGSYAARFAGVLFPGETIVTAMWLPERLRAGGSEDDRIVISASCKERGTPVISNAAITVKG
jgi:acyl dehydratase